MTWGIFPGREIIQPTVVDPISFMFWKVMEWEAVHPGHLESPEQRTVPNTWLKITPQAGWTRPRRSHVRTCCLFLG